jgi:hypothetical protein
MKSFLKPILLGCALLTTMPVWAQDTTATNDLLAHVPRQAIRFSPLHLLSFYPTLQFSVEQRLYRQLTLVGEYGQVLNYSNSNKYSNKRGYKAKGELRYYITQYKRLTVYAAGEYYWNAIRFDRWAQRREYFDQYPILVKFPYMVTNNEYGVALKGGFLIQMPHKMFFDFNVGLRMRVIDYDKPVLDMDERDARDDGRGGLEPEEDDRTVPGIVVGVRFGYRFR